MKYLFLPALILLAAGNLFSQSLFESAVSDNPPSAEQEAAAENSGENTAADTVNETDGTPQSLLSGSSGKAEFSGSVKGLVSAAVNTDKADLSTENSYGEFRGEIKISPSDSIKAFSEIILTEDANSDTGSTSVDMREAYIDIYNDFADFSIGKKIIVWGKADAVNPTNIITPYKAVSVSADEDDRRDGNLLTEAKINIYPFTVTAIWIPVYKQSQLPSFIETDLTDPDPALTNTSFALKTDFESSAFDCSVSYFNGYNPSPGITDINAGKMELKPYRIHNIGFDFSTTVSDYGLRGETAFLIPYEDHEKINVPSPELSYIAGIDRSIGDFNLILQYSGKYITDFIDEDDRSSLTPRETAAEDLNRIISRQTEKISHSAVFRISLDLLYETLCIETAGSWNFTTEELFLKPLVTWDAADSLTVSTGAFFYAGPDNSLMGMMEENSSSVFAEVKLCF